MGRKSILNLTERQLKVLHQYIYEKYNKNIFIKFATKKSISYKDILLLIHSFDYIDNPDLSIYIKHSFIKVSLYFLEKEKGLKNDNIILRDELIHSFDARKELVLYYRNLLKEKDDDLYKDKFKEAVNLVKKNNNLYSILFEFKDYIMENILRDKLGYPGKKKIALQRVFEFIADIIFTTSFEKDKIKLVEKVKSYYNHTYRFL